jgi:hypothetical protein
MNVPSRKWSTLSSKAIGQPLDELFGTLFCALDQLSCDENIIYFCITLRRLLAGTRFLT